MNDKNNYLIGIIIAFILLLVSGLYFFKNGKIINFDKKVAKDEIINNEIKKYNKGAEKINYTTNMSGLILDNYSSVNNIFFTGGGLSIDSKTFSGEYLNVFNTEIVKNENKFSFNYNIGNSLENNSSSGSKNGTGVINNGSGNIHPGKTKNYELIFLKGFTKMKFLGKIYNYNENNVFNKTTYDLQLFLVKDKAFVLQFENTVENASRKTKFEDYSKKIEDIKTKYWNDPYIANKLIKELNKSYNIEIDKLQ